MANLPTRAELFQVGRRAIANTPNTRINPAVVDVPGSDLNILVGSGSLMGEAVVAALSNCMRGLFVELARADQLDRVAFDRYGLQRFPATPATDVFTLARPVPGIATPGTYPAGSRVQSPAGTQFATDVDLVFGNFQTTGVVNGTALVAGPGGNVQAGTVTQFADAPFDPTFTVTNAGAAGGADAEDDAAFRGRIRNFFPTVRRAVIGAIEFGALQVPGVAVARAFEVENVISGIAFPAAAVQLIVSDAEGNFSGPMLQAVVNEMLQFRAAGIEVFVSGGVVVNEAVAWHLAFTTNVNTADVAEQVRAVTVAVAQNLAPGATLLKASLVAGARSVPGAIVNDDSLVVPVGDVVPTSRTQIIRVRPQDVSFV